MIHNHPKSKHDSSSLYVIYPIHFCFHFRTHFYHWPIAFRTKLSKWSQHNHADEILKNALICPNALTKRYNKYSFIFAKSLCCVIPFWKGSYLSKRTYNSSKLPFIEASKPLEHSLRPYSHLGLRTTSSRDQIFSKKDARQLRKGGIFWKRAPGRTHSSLSTRCNVGTFTIKPVTVRQAEAADLWIRRIQERNCSIWLSYRSILEILRDKL